MPDRLVLVDFYSWSEPIKGDPQGRRQFHTARKGETITVTAEEAKRGDELEVRPGMYALGDAEALAKAEREAAAALAGTGPLSDDVLQAMNVEALVAYAGQFPNSVPHLVELETARKSPRKAVLDLEAAPATA